MTTTNATHSTIVSDEKLLNVLAGFDNLFGEYIRGFPGKDSDSSSRWLDDWFRQRSQWFLDNFGSISTLPKYTEDELRQLISLDGSPFVVTPYCILSLQPHYFRGFRKLDHTINLTGDLVVLDGRNSSGKTSLTEAFEWLITGELLRRKLNELGNSRELENCICNQLKPDNEQTWVEASFESETGDQITLKRILERDYGSTQTSTPASVLFKDGQALNKIEEATLINEMFAGEHPLLMQHSLRLFISSTPSDRRDYFERLLLLDEITYLIEKSVIGNARLPDFPAPSGGVAHRRWENFKLANKERDSKSILKKAEQKKGDDLETALKQALVSVASREFAALISENLDINQIRSKVRNAQQVKRQQKFPILEYLRPQKAIDESLIATFSGKQLQSQVTQLLVAYENLQTVRIAGSTIGEAQLAVAKAFQTLKTKNLILDSEVDQVCPLCGYEAIPTLTKSRTLEISNWQPLQNALTNAQTNLGTEISGVKTHIASLERYRQSLIPSTLDEQGWEGGLKDADERVKTKAQALRQLVDEEIAAINEYGQACSFVKSLPGAAGFSDDEKTKLEQAISTIAENLSVVLTRARAYADAFVELEEAVGSVVSDDPSYDLRQQWLDLEDVLDDLVVEIQWEQAKKMSQTELQNIRDILMAARKVYLENRRVDFSDGISDVWRKLREDRYSAFSQLRIPPPQGRGFPVEIELKATLDDSNQQVEVDALRVFSESQINVLGIAAFITRAKLIGHRMLIIDDPVQSMDEEHFLSFAQNLLPHLIEEGFQVIILTHNDTFARDISHHFYDHNNYVTLNITHSRRKGCVVNEGNRRVAERLKRAEDLAEDGDIEGAWLVIRKAMERLYLVTFIKYGPEDFKPHSWQEVTAEHMWGTNNQPGVGQIIDAKVPGSGDRLKQILTMTAAGAHDKSARGKTDVFAAIRDLRDMLPKLRVGG